MDQFIESLRTSAALFSDAVRSGPPDAPVDSCPGWTLTDLAHHLGGVHRWARLAALTGAPPDQSAIDPPPAASAPGGAPGDLLADWIDAGAGRLVEALQGLDPAAPTWHPFPVPKVAAVWPRRQAHETQVHAWDAQHAIGPTSPLDPAIAADGIAEYFEIIAPGAVQRSGRAAPIGTLTIQFVDAPGRLLISSADGATIQVERAATDDEARSPMLWGSAEGILLSLWGRAEHPSHDRQDVVAEWLAFGGN